MRLRPTAALPVSLSFVVACAAPDAPPAAAADAATAAAVARGDSLADEVQRLERQLASARAEVRRLSAAARGAGASEADVRARGDTDGNGASSPPTGASAPETTERGVGAQRLLRFPGERGATITYVGDVRDGKAHGYGYAVWSTGTSYEGGWVDGKRSGIGTQRYADNERFEGRYADDKRDGEGTYYYKSGQKWVGPWKDNLRHGTGILFEADGRVRVKGVWEKDRMVREIKD